MEEVVAAVERKYLIAGHSCRFMFDYSEDEIIHGLTNAACEKVQRGSIQSVETLVVNITKADGVKPEFVPVSMAAAVMYKYKLLDNSQSVLFRGILVAVRVKQWPMLGWHFEQDVINRLKAHPSEASCCYCWFSYTRGITGCSE
mmetsp:Transcript_23978/g.32846  ORF Transcript_23978/g.32846 Transcript_23978/m.32846 type:complete len:144 (-) Transcript_23978:704-1135(-)